MSNTKGFAAEGKDLSVSIQCLLQAASLVLNASQSQYQILNINPKP